MDRDEVELIGHRLQKVYDYSYDTDAECDDQAVAQLRKHDAAKKRGEIETLPNAGLGLFDVVTVTDARARGLDVDGAGADGRRGLGKQGTVSPGRPGVIRTDEATPRP